MNTDSIAGEACRLPRAYRRAIYAIVRVTNISTARRQIVAGIASDAADGRPCLK